MQRTQIIRFSRKKNLIYAAWKLIWMNMVVFKIIGIFRNSLRNIKRNSNVSSRGLTRLSKCRISTRGKNKIWLVVWDVTKNIFFWALWPPTSGLLISLTKWQFHILVEQIMYLMKFKIPVFLWAQRATSFTALGYFKISRGWLQSVWCFLVNKFTETVLRSNFKQHFNLKPQREVELEVCCLGPMDANVKWNLLFLKMVNSN